MEANEIFLYPDQRDFLARGERHGGTPEARLPITLNRYRAIISRADHGLTDAEFRIVCDAMRGTFCGHGTMPDQYDGIIKIEMLDALDGFADGFVLAKEWRLTSAEANALRSKIEDLDIAREMALLEAVEQFWSDAAKR